MIIGIAVFANIDQFSIFYATAIGNKVHLVVAKARFVASIFRVADCKNIKTGTDRVPLPLKRDSLHRLTVELADTGHLAGAVQWSSDRSAASGQ